MSTPRPVLQILVASTRPGRVGEPVARWIAARAAEHAAFDVEVVDLAEVDLPMFAEPKHPRFGEYTLDHTREFSATISRADGFVFVFPEYNHSYNAALKNALDHLNQEIQSAESAYTFSPVHADRTLTHANACSLPPPVPSPRTPSPQEAALSGLTPPSAARTQSTSQSAHLHPARGRPATAVTSHAHERCRERYG